MVESERKPSVTALTIKDGFIWCLESFRCFGFGEEDFGLKVMLRSFLGLSDCRLSMSFGETPSFGWGASVYTSASLIDIFRIGFYDQSSLYAMEKLQFGQFQ